MTALVRELPARRILVGLSGGLDSTVLLHAVKGVTRARDLEMVALHVDHGIHPCSASWWDACADLCGNLGVTFESHRVELSKGGNLEARARQARYTWFSDRVREGDLLLLAHHRDDQAETLLYNLVRGAGVEGAAAMPRYRRFSSGYLGRPLLAVTRRDIVEYATAMSLTWVDDPSNGDTGFDRNYLRHRVLPALRSRFPGVDATLARAAANFAEAASLQAEVAVQDIAGLRVEDVHTGFFAAPVLDVPGLTALSAARRANVLRTWLAEAGAGPPPRQRLVYFQEHLLGTSPTGSVGWMQVSLRRYRDRLYLVSGPLPVPGQGSREWFGDPLDLPLPGLSLRLVRGKGGLTPALFGGGPLKVCFGGVGDRVRPRIGGASRALRKLYQERGVPPWLRPLLPKLYLGDALVAVPGVVMAGNWRVAAGEEGWYPVVDSGHPTGATCVEAMRPLW